MSTNMSLSEAKALTRIYLESDLPVFLWGKPGIGKTDLVYQLAAESERPVHLFTSNIHETVDLRGLPAIDRDKTGKATHARWLAPADLPDLDRDGPNGILFLDDVLTAPPAMQAPLFGLALNKRIGDYHLPEGWQVIAASNYVTDKAGANRINLALANRFAHVEVTPTLDDFATYASETDNVPVEIIAFLRFRPAHLHNSEAPGATGAFPSPRAWEKLGRILPSLTTPALTINGAAGIVGEASAIELAAFLRTFATLPNLDDVIKAPHAAPIPSELSAQYAVTTALARKVTTKTIDAAFTYMTRLQTEFQCLFAIDCSKRDRKLAETRPFITWVSKNQHFMLG